MRFSVAAVAATLAATAQARIYGISVPETIKPGDKVELKIISQGYIQRVDDIAIAFGYNSKSAAYPDTLGNLLDSFYLGPDESNLGQAVIVKSVTFPDSIAAGEGVVSAGLYSLYGVSKGPTLSNYNVTITFGDSTSTTYKNSF